SMHGARHIRATTALRLPKHRPSLLLPRLRQLPRQPRLRSNSTRSAVTARHSQIIRAAARKIRHPISLLHPEAAPARGTLASLWKEPSGSGISSTRVPRAVSAGGFNTPTSPGTAGQATITRLSMFPRRPSKTRFGPRSATICRSADFVAAPLFPLRRKGSSRVELPFSIFASVTETSDRRVQTHILELEQKQSNRS